MLLDSITTLKVEDGEKVMEEIQEMLQQGGPYDADILFLGAGPGGYIGAIRAGKLGARAVIIEKDRVGGTCLNVGCIPTKALLSTVEVLEHVRRAAEFGINVEGYSVDFGKIMDRKDKIVDQLRKGVEFLFKKENVRLVRGTGRLIDAHTVEVATEDGKTERITSRNIIIATGSVPALLPLPGFEVGGAVWTSNEALAAAAVPKSLLVVGGGYVGLEFGYTFTKLGTQVTVVEMLPQIAGTMDGEVAKELEKSLKRAGLKILTSTSVLSAEDIPGGKRVTVRTPDGQEQQIEAEKVLVSVGRKPFTDGIGLDALNIRTERGRILVNDRMQTNVPGVYAIGDVVGDPMLAHVAFHESLVAVSNCLGQDAHVDYKAVPCVVFTHPEVASVGLTEEKAREQYGDDIRVGRFPFAANGKALGMGEREGFAKVISEPKYGEILGVHIIGPHATDMIAEAVVAIQSEATIEDIEASIHPHPTLSEPIHEAALDTIGQALHKA
jgi:dihydrolipoamide dehydrogenase